MNDGFKTLNFKLKDFTVGDAKSSSLIPFLKQTSAFYSLDQLYERKVIVLDEDNFQHYEVQFKHKFNGTGIIYKIKSLTGYDIIQIYTNAPDENLNGYISNLIYYAETLQIISDVDDDKILEYYDRLEEGFDSKDQSKIYKIKINN